MTWFSKTYFGLLLLDNIKNCVLNLITNEILCMKCDKNLLFSPFDDHSSVYEIFMRISNYEGLYFCIVWSCFSQWFTLIAYLQWILVVAFRLCNNDLPSLQTYHEFWSLHLDCVLLLPRIWWLDFILGFIW